MLRYPNLSNLTLNKEYLKSKNVGIISVKDNKFVYSNYTIRQNDKVIFDVNITLFKYIPKGWTILGSINDSLDTSSINIHFIIDSKYRILSIENTKEWVDVKYVIDYTFFEYSLSEMEEWNKIHPNDCTFLIRNVNDFDYTKFRDNCIKYKFGE